MHTETAFIHFQLSLSLYEFLNCAMASRCGRESAPRASEAHDLEMSDPSIAEVKSMKGFPVGECTDMDVEESINNSLHRSWEPLSPTATPSTSDVPADSADESRPLLSRHARQIEERRQGNGVVISTYDCIQ